MKKSAPLFLALLLGNSLLAWAAAPQVGEVAPEFRLQDQNGEWRSLSDYRGQWLIVYFYPKDQTPGCTTEACNFRDEIFKFRKLGVAILGISLDDIDSHKEFAEKYSLPFPLLADVDKVVASRYSVLKDLGPIEFANRETFVVDPDGVIRKHYAEVKAEEHAAQLLTDLDGLIGGGE